MPLSNPTAVWALFAQGFLRQLRRVNMKCVQQPATMFAHESRSHRRLAAFELTLVGGIDIVRAESEATDPILFTPCASGAWIDARD